MRLPLLTCLCALLGFALPVPPLQAASWNPENSGLSPDPAVRFGQFENGLRYAVRANREPRERASLRLLVTSGSLLETDEQRGLAHYLEHMAFNGTENFPAGSLVAYFQRLGMAFGPDTNAATGFDRTFYQIELPRGDHASLEEAYRVLRDFAVGMLLEPEEIESERGVILAEMRDRDSVEFRTAVEEYGFYLPDAIIADRFPIGIEETVRAADRARLLDYFQTWYRPERMVVVAVGDLDPDAAVDLLRQSFGAIEPMGPAREEPPLGEIHPVTSTRLRLHHEPESPYVRISLGMVAPAEKAPDSSEARLAELPEAVAHDILALRLQRLAEAGEAPITFGYANSFDLFGFARIASLGVGTPAHQLIPALQTAEAEIRRVLEHGFHPPEVREIAARRLARLRENARAADTRLSAQISDTIMDDAVAGRVHLHPADELALFETALATLTAEDCHRAFSARWDDGQALSLFVTGNFDPDTTEDALLSAFHAGRARPVDPPPAPETEGFAYDSFGPPGEVVESTVVEDLDLELVRFSNGLRANLKATDFEDDTVHLRLRVGYGRLLLPAENPGLAALASQYFLRGGLGRHSAPDLERILAGHRTDLDFNVADDAFIFRATTTPEDLLLQLRIIAAYLTDPGFRPEPLRSVREEMELIRLRLERIPQGVLQTDVPVLLSGGDHRFGLPPVDVLLAPDLDDLRAWLGRDLQHGPLELAVVGAIDPATVKELLAVTLGALPQRDQRQPQEEFRRLRTPDRPPSQSFVIESAISQGLIALYFPTDDIYDIRRTRRLSLLADTLSDRLRIRIREEFGAAYSPDAFHTPSDTFRGYGHLQVRVGVDPAQADEILEEILSIAATLAEEGIDAEELERAVNPALTSIRQARRSNAYWLNSVLSNPQEIPERIEWARSFPDDLESVTPGEINRLAAQFLHPARAARFVILTRPPESPLP